MNNQRELGTKKPARSPAGNGPAGAGGLADKTGDCQSGQGMFTAGAQSEVTSRIQSPERRRPTPRKNFTTFSREMHRYTTRMLW